MPEGFTRFDSDTFALSHPEDWDVGQREGESFTAFGETGAQGIHQAAIVEISPTFSGDFDLYIDGINDLARLELPDFNLVGEEEVEVDGAAQAARLTESTYLGTAEGAEEATVPMRQLDLFALNGDEVLYYLRVNAPEELFDAETSRQIIDSFTLRG